MDLQIPIEPERKKDTVRTNVRFTLQQYRRIREESHLIGRSIPTLLKNSHFQRKPIRILMHPDDRKAVFAELRRIGNNVNQIAKKINSDLLEGWYPEFQTATQSLVVLEKFVAGIYGIRQNEV